MELEQNPQSRTWGMICHLSVLAGYVIPFGNVIGPLIVWQVKKTQMPFVNHHGKEVMNFQLTMLIAFAVSAVLYLVVIGVFLMMGLALVNLVLLIIAAVKANQGEFYRYPFSIKFFK